MHLDDELVERLRHDELTADTARSVREHVTSCDACRALVAAADQEERGLVETLRLLDHYPPLVSAASIAAKARRNPGARRRWIAAVLTVTLAGVAYATPGSPVRLWLDQVLGRYRPQSEQGRAAARPREGAPVVAGIAVDPGLTLVIGFEVPRAPGTQTGMVTVTLVDSAEVIVRAPVGAATFTSSAERVSIERRDGSAAFEILIPRSAPRVEITVSGRTAFVKAGRSVLTAGVETAPGRYTIALAPPTQSSGSSPR